MNRALVAVAFVANFKSYDFLSDDCFIGFRYARHLADGEGLVWNPGERVEGYTNFLWVLSLAAGMQAGIAPETLSRGLGFLSGGLVLAALAWLSASRRSWSDPSVWVAPAALALHRSFAAWSSGGLETQAFALLVLGGYTLLARERSRGSSQVWSALVLALATLTRPEGALFFGLAAAFRLADVVAGRLPARRFAAWCATYLLLVGAHLLWRRGYYGFWLPNTFYAKVPGLLWQRGFEYLTLFHRDFQALWLLPFCLALAAVRRGFTELLFAAALLAYGVYIAAIGGDRFEFRMLVPVLPLFYWLAVEAVLALAGSRRELWLANVVRLVLCGGLLVLTHRGSSSSEAQGGARAHREPAGDGGVRPRPHRAGAVPPLAGRSRAVAGGSQDRRERRRGGALLHALLHGRSPGPERRHDRSRARAATRPSGPRAGGQLELPRREADRPQRRLQPHRLRRGSRAPARARGAIGALGSERCLQVDGRSLLFTTTLSDEEFARTFHWLARCW